MKKVQTILKEDPGAVKAQDEVGRTALHYAAESGNVGWAAYLIKQDAMVNEQDDYFESPLHLAVRSGSAIMTRFLMAKGADPELCDAKGRSSISYAIEGGLSWIVKIGHGLDIKNDAGDTALIHFVRLGDVATVRSLLDQGAGVNVCSTHEGRNPLWEVTDIERLEPRHMEIAEMLYKHGANVNAKLTHDRADAPLCASAMRGHTEMVKWLLDRGADTNIMNGVHFTALAEACFHEDEATARLLIERGANVEETDGKGYTPLCCATRQGLLGIVQAIVDSGRVDVNRRNRDGWTALTHAARHNYPDIVELLLKSGADPETRTDEFNGADTPLTKAAACNSTASVIKLLDVGHADINAPRGDGWAPLMEAATRNCADAVLLLLERGADVNRTNPESSESALKTAAEKGHSDVVKILVRTGGADVNGTLDKYPNPPIVRAVFNGHLETVSTLLELGAEPDIKDKVEIDRYPLLNYACKVGYTQIVALLLKSGKVSLTATNIDGYTPLHEAAGWGQSKIVRLLLLQGADRTAKESRGRTPLEVSRVARTADWPHCVDHLQDFTDADRKW